MFWQGRATQPPKDTQTDTEFQFYKILRDDVNIISTFFTFNERTTRKDSPEFIKFKNDFVSYIREKKTDFYVGNQILLRFAYARPKLLHLIPSLCSALLGIYESKRKEIIYEYNHSTHSEQLMYPLFSHIYKDVVEPGYEEKYFNIFPLSSKNVENEFLTLIYNDDIQNIKLFLSNHSTFNSFQNFTANERIRILLVDDPYLSYEMPSTSVDTLNSPEVLTFISAIDLSCLFGSFECFKFFLLNGFKITQSTVNRAIQGGNFDIIQNIFHNNLSFDNKFLFSVSFHRYEISEWLFTNYKVDSTSIINCVLCHNFKIFLYLYHNGFSLKSVDDQGRTLVHVASVIGYTKLIEFLLSIGLDKDSFDLKKLTPIYLALTYGHFDTVVYLLSKKCKYDIGFMQTPLQLSASAGLLDIVKYLVSNGYEQNLREKPIFSSNKHVIDYLNQHGYMAFELNLDMKRKINEQLLQNEECRI